MKEKSMGYILYIALFFFLCIIPSLGILVVGEAQPAANEILPQKPVLMQEDGAINMGYFDDVTEYVGKRFAFRQELVTANAMINAKIFRHSPSEKVMVGEEDWLFYEETKTDYLRTQVLTDREVYGAVRSLKLLQDACLSQGKNFLFTIVPNKNSLYPEYMRNVGTPLERKKNLELFREELQRQGVSFLDLESEFQAQEEILYFHTDSHWNNKGAAFARDLMMQRLGVFDGIWFSQEDYTVEKTHLGDLYEMLYPKGNELEGQVHFDRTFTFVDAAGPEQAEKADRMMIQTVCEGKSGSLIMFRDSFGDALYPFLAESFGASTFSRKIPYDMGMIESSEADTVILEIVERNLDWLKVNPPLMPAPSVDFTQIEHLVVPDEASIGIPVFQEEGLIEGYVKLSGTYPEGIGMKNTPIYIKAGGSYYEAFPTGNFEESNCFTAYLPSEKVNNKEISLVLEKENSWKLLRMVVNT